MSLQRIKDFWNGLSSEDRDMLDSCMRDKSIPEAERMKMYKHLQQVRVAQVRQEEAQKLMGMARIMAAAPFAGQYIGNVVQGNAADINSGMAQTAAQTRPIAQPTNPLRKRTEIAINGVISQLPHNVLQKIYGLEFKLPEMAYVVRFVGGGEELFLDIDTFPSDADIARILLMCP